MWRQGYSGVETYAYASSRPHAVTSAGAKSYGDDANGNMTSRAGQTITWHSYDKAKRVDGAGTDYSEFSWGANREAIQQVRRYNGSTQTIRYAGLTESNSAGFQHDVLVDGNVVARLTNTGSAESFNVYLHDHLGSVIGRSNPGTLIEQSHFSAFGERRDTSTWTQNYTPPSGGWGDATGYTGHEQLHHLNLVQMQGRIYDPALGRFLSADPFVPDPDNTQAFNRYSYVYNQPLDYTDPSGFSADGDTYYHIPTVNRPFAHWVPLPKPPPPQCKAAATTACYGAYGQIATAAFNPTIQMAQVATALPDIIDQQRFRDFAKDVGRGIADFVILDTIRAGEAVLDDLDEGRYGAAAIGTAGLACEIGKACKIVGKGVGWIGDAFKKLRRNGVPNGGLGDLTKAEVSQIQSVVDEAGRPLEVVGSAASGTRRRVGSDLPIGKGPGTRSDIDVLVPPSSRQHFEGLEHKLPSLDPKSGVISGTHNPHIGPAVRFEPGADPRLIPGAGGG